MSRSTTRAGRRRVAFHIALPVCCALLSALPAGATGPQRAAGGRPGFPAGPTPRNPAGPTPLNPAGPTPLNPAGAPPLNAAGAFAGGNVGVRQRHFVGGGDAFFQPQPFVAVVGPSSAGSFFCQVHGRGFASEGFFFDHLAQHDGIAPDAAAEMLIDGGGVWVFPGFAGP